MPATSIFPERRTRSQLTLPDTVLAIPEKSPLKIAKSRNTMASRDTVVADSEEEDELMLSPSSKAPPPPAEPSKRSASPPAEDEYAMGSSGGRDLKRRKRDGADEDGMGKEAEAEAEGSGPANAGSEPRRSMRNKFSPSKRKPISTVSASPPPTTIQSPAPVNGRAQSVPLFVNAEDLARTDIPRIDLTKVPRSPKRKRSRSRSPVKDSEAKLRITNAAIPFRLPTIHAGIATGPLSDGETSVAEEKEMEIPAVPQSSSPTVPGASEASSSPTVPTPSNPPATPAASSLDQYMPMSPLTPVPPTPFPPARKTAAYTKSKLSMQTNITDTNGDTATPSKASNGSSGVASLKQTQASSAAAAGASSSRLPKPSMVPPAVPSKSARALPQSQLQSKLAGAAVKKPPVGPSPLAASSSMPSTKAKSINAFAVLMANRGGGGAGKGKGKAPATSSPFSFPTSNPEPSSSGVGPSFAPVVAKPMAGDGANGKTKMKMKDKMRKKTEQRVEKSPLIEAFPEEEEEQEEEERRRMEEVKVEVKEEQDEQKLEETSPHAEEQALQDKALENEEDLPKKQERRTPTPPQVPEEPKELPQNDSTPMDEPTVAISESEERAPAPAGEDDVVMEDVVSQPQHNTLTEEDMESNSIKANDGQRSEGDGEMDAEPTSVPTGEDAIVSTAETTTPIAEDAQPQPEAEAAPVEPPAETDDSDKHRDMDMDDVDMVKPANEEEEAMAGDVEQDATESTPTATKQSKTSLGKKRQPQAPAKVLPARVTRSSSTKKPTDVTTPPAPAGLSRKQPKPTVKTQLKRTASGNVKQPEASTSSSVSVVPRPRTPGSPMKLTTPKKASPALTRDDARGALSVTNTPARRSPSPRRAASSPSPTKASRALPEYTPLKPAAGLTRTFSASQIFTRPGSSLSTLSNALQKLHRPAPSRPSTSMGFNPDTTGDDTDNETLTTKDDGAIGQRKSVGLVRTGTSVSQRSVTLGSDAFRSGASGSATTSTAVASSSSSTLTRPTASSQAKLVQRKLPFGPNKPAVGPPRLATTAARGRVVGAGASKVRPLFGVAGGLRRTASKKSTLPVVIGSPVKGGSSTMAEGAGEAAEGAGLEEEEDEDAGGEIFNTIMNTGGSATTLLTNLLAQQPDKGKARERDAQKAQSHSRRVSMLSRDLITAATATASGSDAGTAAGPSGGTKGLMGPPPTPPSVASTKSTSDSGSPSTGAAKRSSARIAKSAAAAAETSAVAAGKKRAAMDPPPVPNPAAEALQVLNDCVIFVDVKTDDGDEAGSLFVDMLGTLGARIAAGVGQRCTHIVFKNGLSSTTNKYRALRDPKPHVVSIGWVVACVEQRKHIPEADYLVDLEFANVIGANKRRRASAFHKLLTDPTLDYSESAEKEDAAEEGDRSMDGSVSSITMEDDGLGPLERARRRKSMMVGLNH